MLTRAHVAPFMRTERGRIRVRYLPPDARTIAFLERLCTLVRRLEGCPRDTVVEALRRQERRVRDAARLAGIAKTLLDRCEFRPPAGAEGAEVVRDAVFRARGRRWPPVPGDADRPYREAAATLGASVDDVRRLLYADLPGARELVRAPQMSGRELLGRYNLELARAVLLDAERVRVFARGGWRGIFRAVKRARLMHRVTRRGRGYEIELTGPAAAYVVRPARYGARLAAVVPALARAPGWRLLAELRQGGATIVFRVAGRSRRDAAGAPVGRRARAATYDSEWERSLATEFRKRLGNERGGWTLSRETTPIVAGDELFLPDFTLRHADGREALVEIVGFWTPEYLEAKARKIGDARLENLVLVVYRGLAVGGATDALVGAAGADRIVWFTDTPRAAAVMEAVERVARG